MAIKMTDEFKDYLKDILSQIGASKVTTADALIIHMRLVEDIKKMEQARGGLSHEWIELKSRGRIVLPDNIRTAIGATEGTRFDAHVYPNLEKPRGILLIKEEW